jgi:epoxide hydrolase
MSEPDHTDAEIRPFRIEIPQDDLADLQYRLTHTRWANELPPEERGSGSQAGPVPPGWEYGVPVSYSGTRND